MKKIQYIAPSIKVANVKLQNILAGSVPDVNVDQNGDPVGSMDSKRGSFDEDDEEDEF